MQGGDGQRHVPGPRRHDRPEGRHEDVGRDVDGQGQDLEQGLRDDLQEVSSDYSDEESAASCGLLFGISRTRGSARTASRSPCRSTSRSSAAGSSPSCPGSVLTSSTNASPVVDDPQIGARVAAAAERVVRGERVAARRARCTSRRQLGRDQVLACRCACTSPRSRRTSSPGEPRPSRARGRRGCRRTPRCRRCSPRRSPGRGTGAPAATAAASCARSSTMLTPTELPSFAGLTTHGSGQSASARRHRCRRRGRRAAAGASAASARRCARRCASTSPCPSRARSRGCPSRCTAMLQARAQALHRAVLAVRAVQRVPHDVRARLLEQRARGSCRPASRSRPRPSPCSCSAASTPAPVLSETSRSAERPPMTTATRLPANG